ncbi:MAG: DUF4870 domain-containing protein [Candidatus Sumerlaeaceae bacterium]
MPDDYPYKLSLSDESTIIDAGRREASSTGERASAPGVRPHGGGSPDPPTVVEDDSFALSRIPPPLHPLQQARKRRRPALPAAAANAIERSSTRAWAIVCHLSTLAMLLPVFTWPYRYIGTAVPMATMAMRGFKDRVVYHHARCVLNFQLSLVLYLSLINYWTNQLNARWTASGAGNVGHSDYQAMQWVSRAGYALLAVAVIFIAYALVRAWRNAPPRGYAIAIPFIPKSVPPAAGFVLAICLPIALAAGEHLLDGRIVKPPIAHLPTASTPAAKLMTSSVATPAFDVATAAKPGEPVQLDTIEYTVLGTRAARRLAVQPAPTSATGGFIAVDLWAENKRPDADTLATSSMTLVTADGVSYGIAAGVTERHGAIPEKFTSAGVNQGYAIFDAPSNPHYFLRLANHAGDQFRYIVIGDPGDSVEELVPLGRRGPVSVTGMAATVDSTTTQLLAAPKGSTGSPQLSPATQTPLPQLYPPQQPPQLRMNDADYRE